MNLLSLVILFLTILFSVYVSIFDTLEDFSSQYLTLDTQFIAMSSFSGLADQFNKMDKKKENSQ